MKSEKKIAIQGLKGSFHELAAIKYFIKNFSCIECMSFKEVFNSLKKKNADFAIVAIENTVAGTVLPNYAMLRESEMKIIGEIYLRIEQNLLALPGQDIKKINEVHSHPMAILQCHEFFEKYPAVKLIESEDTAGSAKNIADKKIAGTAAIASELAAEIYGLEIIARGIETNKKNFTRFLVITDKKYSLDSSVADKASVCFNVPHQRGSLAKVLNVLADYEINMSKIQSLPLVGKEWEYFIHVDLEFEKYNQYSKAIKAILPLTNEFKILGEYKRGEKVFPAENLKTDISQNVL